MSSLLAPMVMFGADFLFRTLENDKFLKEERRHNNRMYELELQRINFDQEYMDEQRNFERQRLEQQDAKDQQQQNRILLAGLVEKHQQQKQELETEIQRENQKHIKNNPYKTTADIIVASGVGFIGYKIYQRFT